MTSITVESDVSLEPLHMPSPLVSIRRVSTGGSCNGFFHFRRTPHVSKNLNGLRGRKHRHAIHPALMSDQTWLRYWLKLTVTQVETRPCV